MYVVRCADQGFAVSSIRVHLAAIRTAHLLAGLSVDLRHPRLAMVVEGVTRSRGTRPRRQAAPAVPGVLRLMVAKRPSPDTPLGARDRAMLLVGFGAALRRSELVALTLGDVETVPGRRLKLLVCAARRPTSTAAARRSPSGPTPDQPGFCPARRASTPGWSTGAPPPPTSTGPPARRPAPNARCSVRSARPAGSPERTCPTTRSPAWSSRPRWMPASTRSSATGAQPARRAQATAAGDRGAGLAELMRQTRHKSTEIALGYLRPADLWRNNVTEKMFRGTDEQDSG